MHELSLHKNDSAGGVCAHRFKSKIFVAPLIKPNLRKHPLDCLFVISRKYTRTLEDKMEKHGM